MKENRQPLTVRLLPADKAALVAGAVSVGLDPGTAARQVIEIFVRRLKVDDDYLGALKELQVALKPRVRVPAERGP